MTTAELTCAGWSAAELLTLQERLAGLLADQCRRYAAGDSSLPRETAAELLCSLRYVLGLEGRERPADPRPLLREPLEEAFRREQAALEKRTAQARRLWQAACTARPRIENRSLTDTLAGIGAFWRRYDRRFFAHEVPGDIDYQLCLPAPERLLGVDYLISWLSRLLAESRFLNCFDRRAAVRVLEGSCPDYRGLHINLFEPVAVNALGRTLLGLDPLDLALPSEGRARLAGRLRALPAEAGERELRAAGRTLSGGLALDRGTSWYVEAAAARLWPRVRAALPHNDLEGIFLSL